MPPRRPEAAPADAFASLLAVLGRPWAAAVLDALAAAPQVGGPRFSQLAADGRVAGISPRALTARLRELEALGVVARQVGEGVPAPVRYSLTTRGRTLLAVLEPLRGWADAAGGPPRRRS